MLLAELGSSPEATSWLFLLLLSPMVRGEDRPRGEGTGRQIRGISLSLKRPRIRSIPRIRHLPGLCPCRISRRIRVCEPRRLAQAPHPRRGYRCREGDGQRLKAGGNGYERRQDDRQPVLGPWEGRLTRGRSQASTAGPFEAIGLFVTPLDMACLPRSQHL